jgi:general transcription factor 3C polypeptide 3 (transcription factor C subunit 4)
LIFEEKREFEKAYQYNLISAYLNPSDGENWIRVAEMAIELKNYHQAIICYNKAIKIYPKNLSLHQDRCKLYKLIDDKKKALDAYETLYALIIKEPESVQNNELALQVAKEISMLYYINKNVDTSIEVMEENLEKYKKSIINEDVNLYLELLISTNQYVKALNSFKKYCGVNIKLNGQPIDCLTQDIVDKQKDEIQIELIYSELQIDLRAKLAVCLINLKLFKFVGELERFITKEQPDEMGDLFLDIADAYIKVNHLKGAEPLLRLLVSSRTYNCPSIWLKYARLLKELGKFELSIDAYYEVIKHLPKSIEAKLELSDLLVKIGKFSLLILYLIKEYNFY